MVVKAGLIVLTFDCAWSVATESGKSNVRVQRSLFTTLSGTGNQRSVISRLRSDAAKEGYSDSEDCASARQLESRSNVPPR